MNKNTYDVFKAIKDYGFENQRALSEKTSLSLGTVNKCVKHLISTGYIDSTGNITFDGFKFINSHNPRSAIILAAGYGMRMVPINTLYPKALLVVDGETLIERIIKQLHEVGVENIYIVIGFLKEKFEFLIDKYNVKLIVNTEYCEKNNLFSLYKAIDYIGDSYIIPSDIWCGKNPFNKFEPYSWYMVSDKPSIKNGVNITRDKGISIAKADKYNYTMLGIAYLSARDAESIRAKLKQFAADCNHSDDFWETLLFDENKMSVLSNVVSAEDCIEINTYEEYRNIQSDSNQLKSPEIKIAAETFNCSEDGITDIQIQKKGMTNRSFIFTHNGTKYVMRIPGEGTEQLINRRNEANVYKVISERNICDKIKYLNPQNGYKISEYYENSRCCDAFNKDDVKRCMIKLRDFHNMKLKVDHSFDVFEQIDFYESLWNGEPSIFIDYAETKANVLSLKKYIELNNSEKCLSHIDSIPDNFLFVKKEDGTEETILIDWEYAGMQDPHIDIAMFAIYSMYDREWIDFLINAYFEEAKCDTATRIKIYCYVAVCGLLWSNWCEYKRSLGVDFGEYSIRQYRYAKEYFKIAKETAQKSNKEL